MSIPLLYIYILFFCNNKINNIFGGNITCVYLQEHLESLKEQDLS